MSGMTVMEYGTHRMQTGDDCSNRSVKRLYNIFPPAPQILSVTRDLAKVLTDLLVQFITMVKATLASSFTGWCNLQR